MTAYLWAFFAVAGMGGLRWLLTPVVQLEFPFVTLFFAVFLGAWLGGFWPAFMATVLSMVVAAYLFVPPVGELGAFHTPDAFGFGIFLVSGLAVGWMGHSRLRGLQESRLAARRAEEERIRAEESAAMAEEEAARAEEEFTRAEEETIRAQEAAAHADRQTERMQRILASISDSFSVIDRQWTIAYANEQAAAIVGMRVEDLVGKNLWQLFPESIGSPFDHAYRRALETNTVIRMESFYPPLDKWLRIAIYPGPEGLTVLGQDVTEQHRLEAALRESADELEASNEELKAALDDLADRSAAAEESQRRVASILESIGDGFYALDRDWRFVYVNDRAVEVIGRPRESIIGQNIWQMFPELEGSMFQVEFGRALRERRMVTLEERSLVTGAWMSVRAYPTEEGLSVFFQDVSAKHQAAEALKASEERLRLAMDVGRFGIWDWDIPGNRVTWSPRLYEFHGLAEHEFGGRVEDFQRLVHPDDAGPGRAGHPDARWLTESTTRRSSGRCVPTGPSAGC